MQIKNDFAAFSGRINAFSTNTTIASATVTDIGAVNGEFVTILGTATIASFGTAAAGVKKVLTFASALLITYNATSLLLPNNTHLRVAANDVLTVRSLGSGNWVFENYIPITSFEKTRFSLNLNNNFRAFRAKLAGSTTGLCKIVCGPGDSTTHGTQAVTSTTSYPAQLRAILTAKGYTVTGTGIVQAAKGNPTDTRWALAGGFAQGAGPYAQASALAATAIFTSDYAGTVATVWYFNNGGAFTVNIDGIGAVLVTPSGGNTLASYQVTGLANTTHSIVITTTTTSATYIMAAEVRGTIGVTISNFGYYGSKASDWTSTSFTSLMWCLKNVGAADLYIMGLGINDQIAGVTGATFETNMNSVITNLAGSSILLFVPTPNTWAGLGQSTYEAVDYSVALTNNWPIVDLSSLFGSHTIANTNGLMNGDGYHPNSVGYHLMARAISDSIAQF